MSAFVGPGTRGNSFSSQVGRSRLTSPAGNIIFDFGQSGITIGNATDNMGINVVTTGTMALAGGISVAGSFVSTAGGQAVVLKGTAAGFANQVYIAFQDSNGTRTGYVGDADGTSGNIYLESDSGNIVLSPFGAQGMGVGNTTLTFGDATRNQSFIFQGVGTGTVGGAWTYNAPTANVALTTNGATNQWTMRINGANAGSASFGLLIEAGTAAGDIAMEITNRANTYNILTADGIGNVTAGNTANSGVRFTSNGLMLVNAPAPNIATFNESAGGAGYIVYQRGGANIGYVGDSSALVSGGSLDDFAVRAQGNLVLSAAGGVNAITLSSTFANVNYAFNILGVAKATDDSNTLITLGWRDLPINTQSTSYSFILADRGKAIVFNSTNAGVVYTVPAATFNPGATFTVIHTGSGAPSVTISPASGVLLIWNNGSFLTGARTINQGIATIICIAGNTFVIGGSGLS